MKSAQVAYQRRQSKSFANRFEEKITLQKKDNNTGMPDKLKAGLENLSGYDLSHVKVNFNSSRPAQLNALAYAQGSQIHIAPGQEKHLPHEGWHIVQQMQGRVKPTLQSKNVAINDDRYLEREADIMGEKASQLKTGAIHQQGCGCSAAQLKIKFIDKSSTKAVMQKKDKCPVCGTNLTSSGPNRGKCPKCTGAGKNTNAGKGENRNQSFDGESHEGGAKQGRTGRTRGQSGR